MTKEVFKGLKYSKKCTVTHKESGYKYTILFRFDKDVFEAKAYYVDEDEAEFMYSTDSEPNETMDDFVKRVKAEVKMHEDL